MEDNKFKDITEVFGTPFDTELPQPDPEEREDVEIELPEDHTLRTPPEHINSLLDAIENQTKDKVASVKDSLSVEDKEKIEVAVSKVGKFFKDLKSDFTDSKTASKIKTGSKTTVKKAAKTLEDWANK